MALVEKSHKLLARLAPRGVEAWPIREVSLTSNPIHDQVQGDRESAMSDSETVVVGTTDPLVNRNQGARPTTKSRLLTCRNGRQRVR